MFRGLLNLEHISLALDAMFSMYDNKQYLYYLARCTTLKSYRAFNTLEPSSQRALKNQSALQLICLDDHAVVACECIIPMSANFSDNQPFEWVRLSYDDLASIGPSSGDQIYEFKFYAEYNSWIDHIDGNDRTFDAYPWNTANSPDLAFLDQFPVVDRIENYSVCYTALAFNPEFIAQACTCLVRISSEALYFTPTSHAARLTTISRTGLEFSVYVGGMSYLTNY